MSIAIGKSVVFKSFNDVPAAWRDVWQKDDLAMDPKVLQVFQRTLADQCRCWGVIMFDTQGVVAGIAALCMFPTELIETKNSVVIRCRDWVRRFWPGFARMKVLFCGLPVPSGATHIRARAGIPIELVAAEVDRIMRRLAGETGSRLTVFKELDDAVGPLASYLLSQGYSRGAIPPMHIMETAYKNFDEYRDALKSRYRAQVQRSQKKLSSAGFEVLQGRGGAFFSAHLDERVHRLYVAVQQRAEQKLELMPLAFFVELAQELGEEALLTVIRRDHRICAFTFAITRGETHYNMYSGLDYDCNNDGDLYFNLFYNDMDEAFHAGATSLHLGQTSDSFKSRLGSSAQKLWFFAKARPAAFNRVLRWVAPLAFPKVAEVSANDVFTKMKNN